MKRILPLALAAAVCPAVRAQAAEQRIVPVRFISTDGVHIAADYLRPRGGKPVLVMLHGLGAGRREWDPLVAELRKLGYGALQFDARGHGESGGPSYKTFQRPEDWEAIGRDIAAALAFLKSRGFPPERSGLAGASIGANLMLRSAAKEPRIPFVILLSPGMDYQGVRMKADFKRFDRPALLAGAADDAYALRTCRELAPAARHEASRFARAASGHGAQMFSGELNRPFVKELLRWLSERAAAPAAPAKPRPKKP
ncbi:MAG: alpha/beta fold hydrolase [Elusimicrobia bacterium]|nr:alpha/beta fold hydrolase [Elusimicrobiota bacterium]